MTTVPSSPVAAARPRLPETRLREVLRDSFGIDAASHTRLGGEFDQNYRVVDRSDTVRFVRVTQAEPGNADVAWQNALLVHLADTVPDLPVPRVVPAADGALSAPVTSDGVRFLVRVMSWIPGRMLAELDHHPRTLLRELGRAAATLSLGLSSMIPPQGLERHDWDMRSAREAVDRAISAVGDDEARQVQQLMQWYDEVQPGLDSLPHSVVHQDLNDANVLADRGPDGALRISGIVDVGDSLYSARVAELAVAVAYAMVRKDDPLEAAAEVVAGFDEVLPLATEELTAVYPLAAARLCMNAVTWSHRVSLAATEADTEYGRGRMQHTWPTIALLARLHPRVAEARFRSACGLQLREDEERLVAATQTVAAPRAEVTSDRAEAPWTEVDLRPSADLFDDLDPGDEAAVASAVARLVGEGRGWVAHLRASMLRAGRRRPGIDEPQTVQLGVRLLLPTGSAVGTPLAGTVVQAPDPARPDVPLVLRHRLDGTTLHSCWWGLADPPTGEVPAGSPLGTVSPDSAVDALGTGLQVQLVGDAGLATWPPPRWVRPVERDAWRRISLDPAPVLGLTSLTRDEPSAADVVAERRSLIATSQRNYYADPPNLVRGRDVWMYDQDAHAYLDSLNNVTHVGHAEPSVNRAASRQLAKLNTNSRFVYPQIVSYASRLTATLPDPLEVVFLVCTGSEANDLALRIARQVTGREHVVNVDGAYHGNTGVVTGISPNRYKGPGGRGAPPTTHEVPIPDRYRGVYGYDDPAAGERYAADAASVIRRITADGRPPAAFIAESLMGSAGNIVFPDGYLAGVFDAARQAGALCISDEVQVGVGRLGPWWGFELQDVVPDIVTMGKPLGNGYPLAAVVTTRAIADAFDTGMKYFNTFGGNPVACAVGEQVLDVIERDGLRERAVDVGGYYADSLRQLQERQPLIGDVRARGLYLGVELVLDRVSKAPARDAAFAVTELMKDRGVVVFPNGVRDNVLKIKPPMTFRTEHVDLYVEALDEVLSLPELSDLTTPNHDAPRSAR